MFVSLQDHLKAYTLQHLRRLFLRQLLRNILRILYAVFQDVLHQVSQLNILPTVGGLAATRITVFSLFIMLLSKRRLKFEEVAVLVA